MIRTSRILTVSAGCAFLAGATLAMAGTSTQLITTKKLILKGYNSENTLAKFISKDEFIDPLDMNVLIHGAILYVADTDSGLQGAALMESSGWTQKGSKPKFVYKDAGADAVIAKAKLSPGKLKIISRGEMGFFSDASELGTVRVRVDNNAGFAYCAFTPGSMGSIKKDDGEKDIYVAINSEAPPVCPSIVD